MFLLVTLSEEKEEGGREGDKRGKRQAIIWELEMMGEGRTSE